MAGSEHGSQVRQLFDQAQDLDEWGGPELLLAHIAVSLERIADALAAPISSATPLSSDEEAETVKRLLPDRSAA
jgi:hypothetical protein